MNYSEFKEEFEQRLREMVEDGVRVDFTQITRINQKRDACVIKYESTNVAPIIYVDVNYDAYNRGMSMDEIMANVSDYIKKAEFNAPAYTKPTTEQARENLYCAVIALDKNEDYLKNVPYETVADLAVIPRYRMSDTDSMTITYNMCRDLKMTVDEVMEQAHKNTDRWGYRCNSLQDFVMGALREDGASEEFIYEVSCDVEKDKEIYALTTVNLVDGAAAVVSKKAMEMAVDKITTNSPDMKYMYVVGSSRHELLLVPDSAGYELEELKQVHSEVQREGVRLGDRLTDSIYIYDTQTKMLSFADDYFDFMEKNITEDVQKKNLKTH